MKKLSALLLLMILLVGIFSFADVLAESGSNNESREVNKPELCPSVCVDMYEIVNNKCVFNNCGSGCGPDEKTSFKEKEKCLKALEDDEDEIDDENELEDDEVDEDDDEDETEDDVLGKGGKSIIKRKFRENGREVEVKREVEIENGKRKIKIERKFTDAQGNRVEIKIEIKEEDGKRKIKVEGKELEAETELEIESEFEGNESELAALDSRGERHKIKVMPDKVKEVIRERLKNANISKLELKEVKHKNIPRVLYNLQTNQNGKFLGVFKLAMKADAQVDPETGEVLEINRPWWAFLVVVPEEKVSDETSMCSSDLDCINLICPQVIGGDTPRCNAETKECYCGAGDSGEQVENDSNVIVAE